MTDQIITRKTFYPVKQFVSWCTHDQITLRPPFQRKHVWKAKARSFLIDTILKGLPLPIIILRDKAGVSFEPQLEVVDGQQRLTTLLVYVKPELFHDQKFTISKAHNKDLAGKAFADLPEDHQQRILDYELSVHILPSSVDDQQVLHIFSRLNATGVKLNAQELRNAEYKGEFKTFTLALSIKHLSHWKMFHLFTEDEFARMQDVQFTSDLVLRSLKGTTASTPKILNDLYRTYDEEFHDEAEIERRFEIIIQEIASTFENNILPPEFSHTTWFYALFGKVHDALFGTKRGAKAPFLQHVRAKRLPGSFWSGVERCAEDLKLERNLSQDVMKAMAGRRASLADRQARERFLERFVS